jgi:DNA processing protein
MGDRRKAWLGLSRVSGVGPARVRALLDHFGGVEMVWGASRIELAASGLDAKSVHALLRTRRELDLDFEWSRLIELGFELVSWDDQEYPDPLREIPASPPVLYLWGQLVPKDRWAVAIVGTRSMTSYGHTVAEEIAFGLASQGITVVSGLARGIDAIAHRAAIRAGGRTLAVLGSGLDRMYPPEHRGLAKQIAASGCVISDYPLGTEPESGNFPPRNRIISGLSRVVAVIEAGESSGALITAGFAAEQGRDVFAVPGGIHSPKSRGTNRLIRDGAFPLLSVDDVLESLNLELALHQEAVQRRLPANESERRLLEALSDEPVHIDALGAAIDMAASELAASLALLELKGQVRQVGGMHYVLARETGATYRLE